ncbi:hypothetical protein D1Y84_00275 [Acidipila sp. EB88]|nr:hypothetical protein D1Y84_00275 [Acidipila sp. EB88]
MHLDNEHEGRAFYRPSTDAVHMPARNRFVDTPHYYATLFHELIHSTGHENRLARTFGAAFLATIASISSEDTERNTAAYTQNWIKALEGYSRLMITAAAAAQNAVDCILGTRFEDEQSNHR